MEQALPDQAHLLEVLEKLHAKPALREVHGRAGRQFAEESTWERTAERWQALLGEVAPRPSSRATRRPGEAAIEPHAERVETRGATAAERFTAAVELPPPGRQGPTMAILAPTFYDEVSGQPWMGGGERYVVDLAALLAEMGVSAHVFQPSLVPWQRQYGDLTIYGLGVTGVEYDVLPDANLLFHEVTADCDHVLYAGMALCYPTARPGSVAISHGIWWDTAADNWWRTPEWRRRIFRCLENAAMVVSVDTNTINWVRAERPDLAGKFRYLPNAVDLTQFRPSSRTQSQAPLVVLFPRRLVAGRGFEIMLEMASEVLRTNGEVQFRFVGRGTPEAEVHMRELCRREPRVRWEWRRLEDMPEVYQQADITVIPSLFSEGTSLSCLEAMASGNAVLATNIGGLGNLILDGYNGLLVEPSREAILAGLARLLEDWDLRQRLGAHARASAEAFSKERWREQWRSLLNEVYLTGAGRSTEPDRRVRLRAPVVAVVSLGHWGMTGGGQRPQKLAEAWLRRGVSVLHIQQDEPVMSALPDGVGVIGCPELWPGGLLGRPPSDFEGFWRRVDGLCSVRPSVAVLSACSPAMVALAAEFKRHGVPVIYDVLDDWREFSRLRGPKWYKAHSERELVRLADRVTAVSPALVERLGPDHVTLVPNAVDWRLVSSPRSSRRPADLPAKGQLTVGYIGSLGGEWHDWSAAEAIARARPQWALVLIGPGGEMVPTSLTGLPNVRVLEPRPHAEIAECIDHFDVTLVPFRQNALCNAVSPIKAYDYLARGCPVVSSPMSGVQGLPRLKVVHQTEDWVPLIEEAARLPRERPLDWLWENTWDQRVTEFAIGGLLTRRKEPEGGAVEERLGRLVPYPERTRACVEWRMAADCNYECPYCRFDRGAERAAGQWGLKQIQAAWDRFSSDHGPCHVRACGLEPMLGKRNLRILAWLSRDNSLDISTNLAFALPALKPFRRPENVFFSAGFHPVAGVSAGDFVAKVRAVEAEGFTVSEVSMVAYPPYLKRIGDWHREFEQAGIDLQVRPCVGPYEGRQLPQGYTPAEREALARHLAPERLRRLNSPHSSRGRLCATGWRYMVVRADGTVARCPQGEGDWGGFQFYRDRVRLRDHPTVCSFGDCFQEDLQAYCFSEAERLAYLGATK